MGGDSNAGCSEINASVSYEGSEFKSTTLSILLQEGEDEDSSDTDSVVGTLSEKQDTGSEVPDENRIIYAFTNQHDKQQVAQNDNKAALASGYDEIDADSVGLACGTEVGSIADESEGSVVYNDNTEPLAVMGDNNREKYKLHLEQNSIFKQREIIVLPPGLSKRAEQDNTPSEVENSTGRGYQY
ncbi:hypothetical protein GN244_ATG09632 [Phytophthora infestans]|uniref:Uncharacterized protein n=1 Tax=Phytophthora infestans TaxID=4787 RepID=A0A833W1D9_PHYIN|nr:hypothetical protein GN244_ATG09632 [Phytophthora infestans]